MSGGSDLGRDRLAECAGKAQFDSKGLALGVMRRSRSANLLTAYKCRFCGKFHIGSKLKRIGTKWANPSKPSSAKPPHV